MNSCPCGSGLEYERCCHKFILAGQLPQSAEELMRSRYTAFTKQEVDYLKKTSSGAALARFSYKDTIAFARVAKWIRLSIIKTTKTPDPNLCFVEFIADFSMQGTISKIHEISRFERKGDIWYYVEGKHLE
jgi:SEC-C motif-containing protein